MTELRIPEITVAYPTGLCFAAKPKWVSRGAVRVMSITAGETYQQTLVIPNYLDPVPLSIDI